MIDYDFLTLSPNEFENLTRDLLQKKLEVFIESFTTGRDGGIDLRCSKDKSKKTIIQAKRYKDFGTLLSNLKKEAIKVQSLNPDRYIVATSVGLTPNNKSEILKLFSPYIKNDDDIIGKDDINNLIGLYNDIELKYYKLWLASTNILEKVLHSRIYNQSAFELEEIKEQVRLYVQNSSFDIAVDILNQNRYVIISGIPGIGKTTLARVLSIYLLSNGYEEFVYLTNSIDDGYEFFQSKKKQIFFFDDFLGRNFFENKNQMNEDNKIVRFIEKIKKTPNKILILTTREYILNQAKLSYEAFRINNIDIAKCILDVGTYTNIIRAQIIYNHLFFANVPLAHLADLIEPKNHLKIVKHKNYNPRLIETIINRKIWLSCEAKMFSQAIISYFDNPESVWLYAFENSLDKFSQYALLVLLTLGTPVKIEALEEALIEFLKINQYKFQIPYDPIYFDRSLKELENTFIRTQKDSYNNIVIEYQNPSIQDFLVNYLRQKKELINNLLESFIFKEQFISVFTISNTNKETLKQKVLISGELRKSFFERLTAKFNDLKVCRAIKYQYSKDNNFSWGIDSDSKYEYIYTIYSEFKNHVDGCDEFIKEILSKNINISSYSYLEQSSYLNLLSEIGIEKFEVDTQNLIEIFLERLNDFGSLELFEKFNKILPNIYIEIISSQSFKTKVQEIIEEELWITEDGELEELKTEIESICSVYDIFYDDLIERVEERIRNYDAYIDSQIEDYLDRDYRDDRVYTPNEDDTIRDIFETLIEK